MQRARSAQRRPRRIGSGCWKQRSSRSSSTTWSRKRGGGDSCRISDNHSRRSYAFLEDHENGRRPNLRPLDGLSCAQIKRRSTVTFYSTRLAGSRVPGAPYVLSASGRRLIRMSFFFLRERQLPFRQTLCFIKRFSSLASPSKVRRRATASRLCPSVELIKTFGHAPAARCTLTLRYAQREPLRAQS